MEHAPWVGLDYDSQSAADRLLIVGFSHWGRYDPEGGPETDDDPDFTRNVVRRWGLTGELRFFNDIADYFGEDRAAFWNRVAFANALPTTVGDGDERYSEGTPEQRAAVQPRVLRLIEELKPARIFVFSRKAWRLWPDYTGALKDGTLRVDGHEVDCGTYRNADGDALAFGMRHPQFARKDTMRALVAAAMRATPDSVRDPDD